MKKKLLLFLLFSVVLLVAAFFAGHAWLTARFERDAVIAQVEQWWDCRATLESSSVSLLSFPATVELRGLKLAPSDDEVAKPLAQRAPFPEDAALLVAEEASLAVSLQDLLSRRYNIEKLHIQKLRLRTEIDEEGDSSLDMMFDSPEEDEAPATQTTSAVPPASAVPTPALAPVDASTLQPVAQTTSAADSSSSVPKTGDAAKPKVKKAKKKKKPKEPFKAADLYLALQVREASVSDASFDIVDLKNQTRIQLADVALTLSDIDVDPSNLADHNRCNLKLSGNIKTSKIDTAETVADINVLADGLWHPFDPATGLWFPDLGLNATLKQGSILGGTPLESQMRDKDMKKMREYGLDLTGLAMGGVLQQDLVTQIHAMGPKLIIQADTNLVFPDYTISLLAKSWINASEDQHKFNGKFTASPELSHRVLSGAEKKLATDYGETLAALAQATINATFMDEQKRLVIPIKSRGALSKPEVSLDGAIGDITDTLKDTGKSLLESLLKN